MCLTIKKSSSIEDPISLIKKVKKKKTVYKVFRIEEEGNKINLFSPYRNTIYYLGQEYTSQINIKYPKRVCNISLTIEKGLHAYQRKNGKMRHRKSSHNYVVIPCIIPAGGSYIIGQKNEIVSNKLVLPDSFIYKGEEYNINY